MAPFFICLLLNQDMHELDACTRLGPAVRRWSVRAPLSEQVKMMTHAVIHTSPVSAIVVSVSSLRSSHFGSRSLVF